jgi:multidrug efflux pump subunit AcrB
MWLDHSEQFPSVTIYFDTKPGVAISQAIAAIRKGAIDLRIPDDIRSEFRGEAAEATKSSTTQTLLYLGAVFAVYGVQHSLA